MAIEAHVVVHEGDVRRLAREGVLDALVARGRETEVLAIADQVHAWKERFRALGAAVGRAVVDDDQLECAVEVSQSAERRGVERRRSGHDDDPGASGATRLNLHPGRGNRVPRDRPRGRGSTRP